MVLYARLKGLAAVNVGREMTLNKLSHCFTGDGANLLYRHKPGTVVPVLNRYQHWGFSLGTASALSPAMVATGQSL